LGLAYRWISPSRKKHWQPKKPPHRFPFRFAIFQQNIRSRPHGEMLRTAEAA